MQLSMNKPPKIARWILSVTNRKRLRENVLGDFYEFYEEVLEANGKKYANVWYWKQALKSIPRFVVTNIYWGAVMFWSYMKISFRNFRRQKLFTFINVFGLAVGIAACMMISLWVQNELNYDRFNGKADRIFRIEREIRRDEIDGRWPIVGAKYKQALIDDIPEITDAARFWPQAFSIRDKEGNLHRQELFAADNSVFNIFDFVLIQGSPKTALLRPKTLVLTESAAIKYFGTHDVKGETLDLEMDGKYVEFEIAGVMRDIPENSHIHFEMLISFSTYPEEEFTSWRSNYLYTYVLTDKIIKPIVLEEKLKNFIDQHLEPEYGDLIVQGRSIHDVLKLYLFPLADIHLNPSENWELESGGSIQSVILFSSIGFLLLIIAGINFINLSTARANRRAKEVSLRKTLGANKQQLRFQFFQESLLLTFIAAGIALVLLLVFVPFYNSAFGGNLSLVHLLRNNNFLVFIGITLSIGFIAGLYPAVYLSKFEPAGIIKGVPLNTNRKSGFRRNMVVFQFAVSLCLLIGMSIVYQQMDFINKKSIGFEKENVITLPARSSNVSKNFETFKSSLLSHSNIISIAGSADLPGDEIYSNGNFYSRKDPETHFSSVFMNCGYDFINTCKIQVIAGRNFSRDFGTDTSGTIILNETAVGKLGLTPEQALGKVLYRGESHPFEIIGVVKDFNFQSLLYGIEPMALFLEPNDITRISVRVVPGNMYAILKTIRTVWEKTFPGEQFDYSFLDQRMEQLYESEQKMQNILFVFTVMSIIVACLGLFGLAAYTAEDRTKEIGIRKTLGATVINIFGNLTKDYLKWILISAVIAYPVSYYLMNIWLENFAYRIEISPMVFIAAAFVTLFITLITVSYQIIKLALINPVETLKYE
jgi:putative ABC transport system permease protein